MIAIVEPFRLAHLASSASAFAVFFMTPPGDFIAFSNFGS